MSDPNAPFYVLYIRKGESVIAEVPHDVVNLVINEQLTIDCITCHTWARPFQIWEFHFTISVKAVRYEGDRLCRYSRVTGHITDLESSFLLGSSEGDISISFHKTRAMAKVEKNECIPQGTSELAHELRELRIGVEHDKIDDIAASLMQLGTIALLTHTREQQRERAVAALTAEDAVTPGLAERLAERLLDAGLISYAAPAK